MQERLVTFSAADQALAGTLCTPDTGVSHPSAVPLPGSGPLDRAAPGWRCGHVWVSWRSGGVRGGAT